MINFLKYIRESLKFKETKGKIQRFKISSVKFLFPYLKTHWKEEVIASLFMIVVSLLALPTPYLIKIIIDDVLIAKNTKLLNLIILLLIVVQLLRLVFSFFTDYLFNVLNKEIIVKIKGDLFSRLLRLPLSFFDNKQTGYILSRIGEVEGLAVFFSNTLVRTSIRLLEFIFCLAIIIYLNWRLTLIALLGVPLFYFATRFYYRNIRRFSREVMEKRAVLSRQIQDTLSGVDVIKVFTAEERETKKIHSYLDELKNSSLKRDIILNFSSELLSLIGVIGGFIVLLFSGWEIIKGDFTVGGYIAFSAYLAKLYGPTQTLATIGLMLQPAITTINRVTELMGLTKEEEKEREIKLEEIKGDIVFNNVYFSYNTKQVIKNINFKINDSEKILITGPNGSGKSTVIKLILGLYKPKKGKILIHNCNINEISLSSLRERISIVSQNTFLFNDTIKNNILYSYPEAKEKDLENVAKLSGAYEFIENLEKRFETLVGENGKKLSGGEKQKISIARAILKDSDIIIFDEATTHLDPESEKRIDELITSYFKDKTCIIISQDIRNTSEIDKIFVLKEGKILDKGKHNELYQRCSYYKNTYDNQLKSVNL